MFFNSLMEMTSSVADIICIAQITYKLIYNTLPANDIGNPGSLCVTHDITQVNYREHMRRSLSLKICWKMEIKIVETCQVASFCCP